MLWRVKETWEIKGRECWILSATHQGRWLREKDGEEEEKESIVSASQHDNDNNDDKNLFKVKFQQTS